MDNNCIFCKIIGKEIPCKMSYEDNDFLAILDLAPATKGHVLILPKEHAATLLDLSDDKLSKPSMRSEFPQRFSGLPSESADGWALLSKASCAISFLPPDH